MDANERQRYRTGPPDRRPKTGHCDFYGAQIAANLPSDCWQGFRIGSFLIVNNTGATIFMSRGTINPAGGQQDLTCPPRFSMVGYAWLADHLYVATDGSAMLATDSLSIQMTEALEAFSVAALPAGAGATGSASPIPWAGKAFPYDEGAADLVVAVNTTWTAATNPTGVKRVGTLTIAAGVVLTIAGPFPFFLFAKAIVFGSATSRISVDGPAGTTAGADQGVAYCRGGRAIGDAATYSQGGAGAGFLIVMVGTTSGAAGVFSADGGAGVAGAAGTGVTNGAGAGEGALSRTVRWNLQLTWTGGVATPAAGYPSEVWTGQTTANLTPGSRTDAGMLLGDGGPSPTPGWIGQGGGSGGIAPTVTVTGGGGSGVGGGGSAGLNNGGDGAVAAGPLNLGALLFLAQLGCKGGGGGGAVVWAAAAGSGGGGGAVYVMVDTATTTPTVRANGGAKAGNAASGGVGGAGSATLLVVN